MRERGNIDMKLTTVKEIYKEREKYLDEEGVYL